MPRIPKKQETCRLTLQPTKAVRERMETLRDATDADTLVEVVRRSLAIYEKLVEAEKAGGQLVIRFEETDEEQMLLMAY